MNRIDRQWLTTADLARIFEMSEATIRRWARQRRLPYLISPGGQYRFDADEIQRLIEQRRVSYNWSTYAAAGLSDLRGSLRSPDGHSE